MTATAPMLLNSVMWREQIATWGWDRWSVSPSEALPWVAEVSTPSYRFGGTHPYIRLSGSVLQIPSGPTLWSSAQ